MKKVLSSVLAAGMAFGATAVTAFAAPVYEADNSTLANTVIGFSTGEKTYSLDLTQVEGKQEISFDLGENASYYNVEIDVKEGGKHLDAEYSKSKKAITVRPTVDTKLTEPADYEVNIEIVNRKNKDTIADGFSITGEISYDTIQMVDSGERYNNSKGVLYDFGSGTDNVEIYAGNNVTVKVNKSLRGVYNFDMSTDSIDELDNAFPDNDLEIVKFMAHPKFSNSVDVVFDISEGNFVYEYVDGKLRVPSEMKYDESEGYVVRTKQLGAYVVSVDELPEGAVEDNNADEEDKDNTTAGGNKPSNDTGKNNPATGASDMMGMAVALSAVSLAAVLRRIAK